ncbi:MAG TPA: hypothetical protein VJ464_07005 [Blastocatellia bacterium]|nr:hypothetical protein [Blastocatellia bacterium]
MSSHKDARTRDKAHTAQHENRAEQMTETRPAEKANSPAETANDKYLISKDDLLKFIELDLWSRFKTRLWGAVTIFGGHLKKRLVEQAAPVKLIFDCEIQRSHLSQVQLAVY